MSRDDDASSDATLPAAALPAADGVQLPTVPVESFTIVGEHARGGMGRVMVAFDRLLGRQVAVKELLTSSPEATARFVREALVTARLQHPSIVPVHLAGRWPSGEPFYVMKLVSGRPLHELIRGCVTVEDRVALLPALIAVSEAIAYAHSQRVIHRDLKPANVLVGEFGETVVVDWGLAKRLDENEPSLPRVLPDGDGASDTIAGAVVGTPGFMAPEQAAGRAVDERTDVYALGAILYTVLCGQGPYGGTRAAEILEQVLAGPPPSLAQRAPEAPEDLRAIVDKAMARDPAARYASARELAADLKRFQTGQLVAVHQYSALALLRRWLQRYRLVVAVALAALAALALLGTVSVRRIVRERDRADRERGLAVAERAQAEAARAGEAARVDELVLAQARAALDDDPTAALAWLKRLRPGAGNSAGARAVASDAALRGVAAARLVGHVGAIHDAAFSPDGTHLATAGQDHTVRLWDLGAGGARTLAGAADAVVALAFVPDGSQLAAAGADGRLRLWDLASGSARVFDGHRDAIADLALSPDGRLAATAGRDHTARVWELASGRTVAVLAGRGPVHRVAFATDGRRLATADTETVSLWDVDGARLPLVDGARPAAALAFSPDGRWLAAGGHSEVRLWALATGRARRLPTSAGVTRLAFSVDGSQLAAALDDGAVMLWDAASGAPTELAHGASVVASDLAFRRDGRQLAAARGPVVRVWDLTTGELRKLRGHTLDVRRVVFSPDGFRLASASLDGTARIWRLADSLAEVTGLGRRIPADAPSALATDGRVVAWAPGDASERYAIAVWRGGVPLRWLVGHTGPVLRLAFSPDGKKLASGGVDQTVRLWDVASGAVRMLGRHEAAVHDVAFSPRGDLVATASDDGSLGVWALAGGAGAAGRILREGEALRRVAFTSDGRALVSVGRDGTLRLTDLDGPAPGRVLREETPVAELSLSRDGRQLVLAAPGSRIAQVIDLAGHPVATLTEDEEITQLDFLDDGTLAIGTVKGALRRVADLAHAESWAMPGPRAAIRALAGAGDSLASLSEDGLVRRWPPSLPTAPAAVRAWLEHTTDATIGPDDRLR